MDHAAWSSMNFSVSDFKIILYDSYSSSPITLKPLNYSWKKSNLIALEDTVMSHWLWLNNNNFTVWSPSNQIIDSYGFNYFKIGSVQNCWKMNSIRRKAIQRHKNQNLKAKVSHVVSIYKVYVYAVCIFLNTSEF